VKEGEVFPLKLCLFLGPLLQDTVRRHHTLAYFLLEDPNRIHYC